MLSCSLKGSALLFVVPLYINAALQPFAAGTSCNGSHYQQLLDITAAYMWYVPETLSTLPPQLVVLCASAGGGYDDASHATRDPCLEGAEFDLPPLDGALWTVRTASALGDHAPSAAPFRLVLGLPRTCVPVRPHTAMCRDRCCGRSGFPLAVAKAVSAHTMQVC